MMFEVKLGSLCFLFVWMIKVDTVVDALACYLTLNSGINILFTYSHNLFFVSAHFTFMLFSHLLKGMIRFLPVMSFFFFPISMTYLY